MTYLDIKKLLEDNKLTMSIDLDIVSSVLSSLSGLEYTDEEFMYICQYARYIWDNVDQAYTQRIADIVVDCVYDCYGYSQSIPLTFEDIKEHNKVDQVIEAYLDKYYE